MAVEWKDTSSWAQSDTDRTPKEWTARIGSFRLTVHRHIHFEPDDWLVSCRPELFTDGLLPSKDIDEAKRDAVGLLQVICERTLRDITGA